MSKRELVTVSFIVSLLISNLLACKLIGWGSLVLPAAVIIYPFCFMFGDVLSEVWGFKYTRKVIWLGFVCNAAMVLFLYLGQLLPPAATWDAQAAYEAIYGMVPRIVAASFLGYLVGEILNSFVLVKIKERFGPKRLYVRTILSSVVGQAVDSGIFITVAFAGLIPTPVLLSMILSQYLVKIIIEASLGTPLAYLLVGVCRREEEQFSKNN
ncbi:MAG: queuosine precursor transporter [Bacillota bacterium]|jgi:uncharacterized integral membrane protein (TIGR00697 family)